MNAEQTTVIKVREMKFSDEFERLVAKTSVSVGPVTINDVAVWRSGNGALKVFFPSRPQFGYWFELVNLSGELRRTVDAEVIAAYKAAKLKAKECETAREARNAQDQ